jgi:hypothetical protein
MLLLLGRAAERSGTREDAVAYLREALGVAALAAHAHTVPVALDRLAGLLAEHDPQVAIALHAAADARHLADQPVDFQARGRSERLDAMRLAAGPDVFAAAWQRGLQAPLEEVVAMVDAVLEPAADRERLP